MQIAASELGPFVPARIHIEADGAVRVVEGGTAELSLDGITFRCAARGPERLPIGLQPPGCGLAKALALDEKGLSPA